MFAVQPSADRVTVGRELPVDWVNITPPAPIVAEYLTESAKYASSAGTRLRRSDFIEAGGLSRDPGSWAISTVTPRPHGFAPRRHRRFARTEISRGVCGKNYALRRPA